MIRARIGPLDKKGFFRHPPALIPVEGGKYLQIPRWPESRLLARLAPSASETQQEQIVSIACAIPDTENGSVHLDLAEVALAVPPRLAVRLVAKAKKWVEVPILFLIPAKLGELAVHLARGGYRTETLGLLQHLLAILPDPRQAQPDQASEHFIPKPRARFKPWSYREILKKHLPEIIRQDGLPVLDLLCKLLSVAVRSSLRDGNLNDDDDYSAIWRPAVENHEQHSSERDLRCMLVEAVRDAAVQVVEANPARLQQIVEKLERHKLTVFARIALHLLRLHGDSKPDLVTERLTRKDLYDSAQHRHEYTLLLQERSRTSTPVTENAF